MDNKRLIHAVAGSGKTTKIIESIDPQTRILSLRIQRRTRIQSEQS